MIVKLSDLESIRKNNIDKKIVLVLGTFDLFHYEHLRFLESAKKLGDILVVAIKDDASVKAEKGELRPIIKEEWRADIIDAIKYVDYTIITQKQYSPQSCNFSDNKLVKSWWELFDNVFASLKPDILYFETNTKLQPARELASQIYKFKLIERQRTEIISTSKIVDYIKTHD